MSRQNEETAPWNDIEALLDAVRVEEEVQLAVLEALGREVDTGEGEFSWDLCPWEKRQSGGSSLRRGGFHT
jgi:hypothetical protein